MNELNFKKRIILKIFSKFNLINLILIITLFSIDRISKIKIIRYQLSNENYIQVNNFLNLDLVWNTGIGFGLFNFEANLAYHLISFIIFIIIVIIIYLIINGSLFDKFSYAIILGGAFGNFYDRIFYFAVPDFIDIHYQNFHWFTFNVADIFITIGIMLLIGKEFVFKNDK
jgi:signal peptidase II